MKKADLSTTFCDRLRRGFSIALVAAAALYALASTPARESPKGKAVRPPIVRPPVLRPPRTGADGAHGYVAPLAEERERWAKRSEELRGNPPFRDKKTGKWSFKNTNETFHDKAAADRAWKTMLNVSLNLMEGHVDGAKQVWKFANWQAKRFWHGRSMEDDTRGRQNRDIRYGRDKAGKARAKADEAAERNVFDSVWHDVKKAEAKGLKPVKPGSPVTN